MFDWHDYEYLDGQVNLHTFTCNTTATALVPDAGMKLIIYKIFVDGPGGTPPLYQFTDG
jgi:hypothetical protein